MGASDSPAGNEANASCCGGRDGLNPWDSGNGNFSKAAAAGLSWSLSTVDNAAQTEPELGSDSIAVDMEGERICCMHPLEHVTDTVRAAVLNAIEVTLTLTLTLTLTPPCSRSQLLPQHNPATRVPQCHLCHFSHPVPVRLACGHETTLQSRRSAALACKSRLVVWPRRLTCGTTLISRCQR